MLHQLDLLVFDQSAILIIISVKCDTLGPSGLPLVKIDILLDWPNMKDLVGEAGLSFY
jgi:hypothetical protein